ncbi:MAG: type VI immunity family protein [Phyllobacterium sp.]
MAEENELKAKSRDWSFLDKIGVASARGTPMLRFGHYIDFIIQDATSVEKRQQMAEVLFEYKKIFADKLTHYIPHDGRRLHSLRKIDYDSYVLERVRTPDNVKKDDGFEASLFGYPDAGDLDDPTIYYAEAIGQTPMREFSRIGIYLPASWPEQVGYDRYRSLIQSWCEKVKPAYGTAGLSILFNEGRQGLDDRLLAFPLAKRFPGLDLPEQSRWSVRMNRLRKRAIRTINWLTYIDDAFVSELGGQSRLAEQLGDLCPIHPYDGGIVIQAGERPELGDVNQGLVPEAYRAVARALKPIRFDEHQRPLIDAPPPLDSLEETMKWVQRFD